MDIVFLETNQTGIIKLNRPKALNALNLDMAKKFIDKLLEWQENNNISNIFKNIRVSACRNNTKICFKKNI